jgi:cyanophycin synthetase
MIQHSLLKKIKHGGVKSLVKKALELGIEVKVFSQESSLIRLEYKGKKVFIRRGTVPIERVMGDMTRNKEVTKMVLNDVEIKTPRGVSARSLSEAIRFLKKKKLSFPLIVKPIDDSLARGVTWNIRSSKEIKAAVRLLYKNKSFRKSKKFIIEEMFEGDEYRVLLFDGKAISCVRKIPASVTGDGKSTIKESIEKFNKRRLKGFEIKIDKVVLKTLKKNRLTLNSVLAKNYCLRLRHNLNMSDGGRAINYTKKMHQHYKDICEKAIEAVGLAYGGIDLLAKDITAKNSRYVIIEINPNPYYNMHEKPLVEGKGIDVSKIILVYLFPKLQSRNS